MKDLENIDDLFSSSLENFEVAPPKEAKKAIEQTLHKQTTKRNKKGGWLLLSLISLSIFSAAMFVQNNNNKNQNVTFEKRLAQDLKTENKNSSSVEDAKTKAVSSLNKKTDNAVDLMKLKSASNDHIGTKLNPKPTNSFTASAIKMQHQAINLPTKIAQSNFEQPHLIAQNESTKHKEDGLNLNNFFDEVNESTTLLAQNSIKDTQNNSPAKPTNEANLAFDKTKADDVIVDSSVAESTPFALPEKIEEARPAPTNFYIAFNLGTGLNTNNYSNNNLISAQELKDSIVFNKPYLSAQLLFGVKYNKLSISTGVGIYKLNDKVKYSYINQKMERIFVDSIYIDPITNDTIVKRNVPIDTLMNYYTNNAQQSTYNILQIPFLATYKYTLAKRLQLDISAGGALNILLQSKGNYKESIVGNIAEYGSTSNNPLKTFNFNAQAIIGISYNINDRTSMQFALPFQIGLSNFYNKEYFIDRRVNSLGVQCGLKYNF
jgi:hypothetical protein